MAIVNGTYRARASGEVVLGESSIKGTPYIKLCFEIASGPNAGGRARWTAYFSERTRERTIQSMQYCGWEGDDVGEFVDGKLHGLDRNEVDIVVELESWTGKDGEPRTTPKVRWVNRTSAINRKGAMDTASAQSFGNSLRGLVLAVKDRDGSGDFVFGANAEQPAPAAPLPAAVPGRKAF